MLFIGSKLRERGVYNSANASVHPPMSEMPVGLARKEDEERGLLPYCQDGSIVETVASDAQREPTPGRAIGYQEIVEA
jgi:hypothetical protein